MLIISGAVATAKATGQTQSTNPAVLNGNWNESKVNLNRNDPDNQNDHLGGRPAVRIL